MKNKKHTLNKLVLCILCFTVMSCEKIEEATQVTLNEDFTVEVDVTILEAAPSYQGNLIINLADNADLNEYLDKIENISITSASYQIKNFQGESDATGTATISSAGQTFGPYTHAFESDTQQLKEFVLSGGAKLQTLSNTLKDTKRLTFNYQVVQEQASNSNFKAVITIKTRITAQAL